LQKPRGRGWGWVGGWGESRKKKAREFRWGGSPAGGAKTWIFQKKKKKKKDFLGGRKKGRGKKKRGGRSSIHQPYRLRDKYAAGRFRKTPNDLNKNVQRIRDGEGGGKCRGREGGSD